MRLVVDTNVLLSALMSTASPSAQVLALWRARRFDLLTTSEQLDEIARVTRYPKIRARLPSPLAGRLVNRLRDLAIVVERLPMLRLSPDPDDNYLLALSEAGHAHFLVTGDKPLLSLKCHRSNSNRDSCGFRCTVEVARQIMTQVPQFPAAPTVISLPRHAQQKSPAVAEPVFLLNIRIVPIVILCEAKDLCMLAHLVRRGAEDPKQPGPNAPNNNRKDQPRPSHQTEHQRRQQSTKHGSHPERDPLNLVCHSHAISPVGPRHQHHQHRP